MATSPEMDETKRICLLRLRGVRMSKASEEVEVE